jgi:DNA polymerase II small subunit
MSEVERLRKAVELTIAAGYQLNKDAFEFLSNVAATKDPTEMMSTVLQKIAGLAEKPFFIDKSLLEELFEKSEPTKEIANSSPDQLETETTERHVTETKKPFHPYAKGVDSAISVIEDSGTKLNSNGSIEDYLGYFRDRFKRMEKLMRQRIDARSAASVMDALRAPPSMRLKIIGIVTEKRESKQRVILNVEDLQASATALVPQNATEEVKRKARSLLLDQVICLSIVKSRGTLLIAEDIVFPEVPQRTPHKAPIPVYAALTSDLHVGSTKFEKEAFSRFLLWLNGKYGDERMQEVAGHVKYVLIAGDIVDGIGIYPNQVRELAIRDVYKQYRLAAKYIEQIPDYIEVVIAPGNHDAPRKALPQPPIADAFLETLQESRKVKSLGDPCHLSVHGVEILMYHGRSLDDVISTVPDMTHSHPEKAMRLLLQGRHLAPMYGGKTPLSPEDGDPLVIDHIPDIFHAGHVHALEYANYRGVLVVNSGCWQGQTDYMRRNGFVPTPGRVPIVDLQTLEVMVVSFN